MTSQTLSAALGSCFEGIDASAVPPGASLYKGKVRDVVSKGDRIALVASDRISAFDRVLSSVPFKGEVLSRISAWWFENTSDIIQNHVLGPAELGGLDPLARTGRCVIGKKCDMLPIEVVVRGYLTGSAWRDYQAGNPISGILLPSGLSYCEKFPVPLLTPSTKESEGHDKPASGEELIKSGLVGRDLWMLVEKAAIAVFRRGQELAARRGLILVDTKYEFGLLDGRLILADEIHTPDSSRYWHADSYMTRFQANEHQRELDKETFRRWLVDRGFSGEGTPPAIDDAVRTETALRYIDAYEQILGKEFTPVFQNPQAASKCCASTIMEALSP